MHGYKITNFDQTNFAHTRHAPLEVAKGRVETDPFQEGKELSPLYL